MRLAGLGTRPSTLAPRAAVVEPGRVALMLGGGRGDKLVEGSTARLDSPEVQNRPNGEVGPSGWYSDLHGRNNIHGRQPALLT